MTAERFWFAFGLVTMVALVIALCVGCTTTTPLSANLVQEALRDVPIKPTGFFSFEAGLKEMVANLDGAISVGITDPRIVLTAQCVHGVSQQLGLEGGPVPTFTPQTTTFLGHASVAFIRAVQAAGMQGQGVAVPTDCKTELGQMVLDGAAAASRGMGGGLSLLFH